MNSADSHPHGVSLDLTNMSANMSREQSEMVSLDLNRLMEEKKTSDTTLVPPGQDVEADPSTAGKMETPNTPPDGGFRAWLQVAGGFFIFFNIWGLPLAYGVFEAFYSTDFLRQHSQSSIAWIGTMTNFLLIFIGFISGPLFDLGYYRSMLITGVVLNVVGIFMTSLCTTYWQVFLAQGLCVGLGSGLMYVPTLSLVAGAFTTKRPIALGLLACGIGLGAIVFVVVFRGLIDDHGFPYTVRALGYILLATFAFAIPATLLGPTKPSGRARSLIDRSAFADWPFLMYTLINVFMFLGYAVPLFYIPAYGQLVTHTSPALSYYLLAVASAASFLGRLFVSLLAPKTGIMPLWVACGASSSLIAFCWIAVSSTPGLVAFSVFYGFCSGGLIALPASVLPFCCPDMGKLGTRMGMSWAPTAISVLVGPPIAGALVKNNGTDYLGVQVWAGVVLAAGTCQTLYVWWLLSKKVGKVWF